MSEAKWTCPHCRQGPFVPSADDFRIGVCDACGYAFALPPAATDGSTWRDQASLYAEVEGRWPQVRTDRYRIIRPLAAGAQGRILLAHHLHLDQICVIKILDGRAEWQELASARLQAEARAGVLVSHANVARVLDCDCVEGAWYFVMEYVPGENLRRVVQAVGRFCWEQVVEVAIQVAEGLSAVHAADLIHRDIKPSNIMLRGDGVPKIMDLGLVKMPHVDGDLTLTHDGQILGTPFYMPPEQFDGDRGLSPQADIYALGATVFHLLAGKPPHQGSGVNELATRHKHDPVIWPEEVAKAVPTWLRHVVEICLAKRPEHRFASADALREALRCGVDVTALLPSDHEQHAVRGVAVADFRNLSRREEDDWIGDALAEYLTSRLLDIPGLHVVERGNLQKMLGPGGDASIDEAELLSKARMVGAGIVIVGAFQRSGGQLRITVRSLERDRPSGPRVTSTVSGAADDLFVLEDQLAAAVLGAIGQEFGGVEQGSPTGAPQNLAAHEKFIRGRRAFADGDYAGAIRLATEALAVEERCPGAASLIGAAYARVGDYDRALDFHQREEVAARRERDDRRLAEALGNIGVMYYYKGEYALAYEFLEQARNLCDQLGQVADCGKYDGNLGFVLLRLNKHDEAERAFDRAIAIHKRYGDLVSLAWPYNGMGGVLLKQQRYAEASEYYRRALGLANEIGDRVNIGISHMNLGRCACLLADYAEAEACFDEALATLEGTDFWNGLTLVYEHMADMYLQEGNTASAFTCIDKRLELAVKHDNRRMEAEAWEQKAKAHELAGEKDAAFACLKRSLEVSQKPPLHESLHRHLSMVAKKPPFA